MSRYRKAIIAAIPALLFVLEEIRQATEIVGDSLTTADTVRIAITAITAALVYAVANVKPAGKPSDPTISEAEVA